MSGNPTTPQMQQEPFAPQNQHAPRKQQYQTYPPLYSPKSPSPLMRINMEALIEAVKLHGIGAKETGARKEKAVILGML